MNSPIINFCKSQQKETVLLSLDMAKTFDSIEKSHFLFRHMGFGPKFLCTLQALYSSNQAQVKII